MHIFMVVYAFRVSIQHIHRHFRSRRYNDYYLFRPCYASCIFGSKRGYFRGVHRVQGENEELWGAPQTRPANPDKGPCIRSAC